MANDMLFGEDVTLFLNQYVFTDTLNQFDVSQSRPIVDARTFASNSKVSGSSENSHTVSASFGAIAKYGTNLSDDVLYQRVSDEGADYDAAGVIFGDAAGDVGREIVGRIDSNARATTLTDVDRLSGAIIGRMMGRVLCVTPGTSITGTGVQTGVEVGANTAGTISFVSLRVTAVNTFTTMTVQIEESQDDDATDTYAQTTGWSAIVGGGASFASDEVTFTSIGWAVLYKTTATEAWLRSNVTALTGTSATLWVNGGKAVS